MDDAKKQRDEFYQLLIDNNEKGACLFQEELYEKLVSHHLCMSSDIRYHYCVMRDMLEKQQNIDIPVCWKSRGNREEPISLCRQKRLRK